MILQGDPYNLQGSAPSIQGGQTATVLQPASSPLPAPIQPRGAPAPQPVVQAAPKAAAPASGAVFYKPDPNSPQVYNAQGQALSYDQYIAQGGRSDFSNVMHTALPGQPTAQPATQPAQTFAFGNGQAYDVNGQPVQQQPQQGASPVPTTPPAIPTGSPLDPNQTRIGELTKQIFQAPTVNQQRLYEDAYNTAGLATVRTKLEDLNKQIADRQAAYTSKEGDINENPFLSEASRTGRLKRLNDQKQAEIGNLLDQYKQYADLYNSGIDEVNKSVERQVGDFNTKRQVGTEELNYLLGIEKTQADNKAALQKSADTFAKDNNITGRFYKYPGSNTVYDSTTREPLTYEQYVARGGTGKPGAAFPDVQTLSTEGNLKDYPASYQEYLLAKKDGFTGNYNDYQNADANRKVSIAKAGAAVYAGGLSNQELTQVQKITGQFDGEPIVKNFNVIAEGKSFVDSISNDTQNPADQQGLIYAFAKAMDPNSVVREGEYATVQKYAQSWAQSFGFNAARIFSNSPFLSPQAIANMKATINSKFSAAKAQYDNVYKEYGRRVDQITGKSGGTDFLTNYASYTQPTQGGSTSGVNLNDLF